MASKKKSKSKTASAAVDDQLARYRSMRDFSVTAEPSGSLKEAPPTALPFVIQKHAATRLHYDFRLGWRGVLKSWAVSKGPSCFPGDKRLAVEVEDHPMDYGGFEGTIPKGQYGGGTVMLWDEGTWEPKGDADEGLKRGNLKFTLHGKKLQGSWVLVRMGGHAARESKPNWLLIKEHDEYERTANDTPITEEKPDSVVTGRDLAAIAEQADHVWNSNRPEKKEPRSVARPATKTVSAKKSAATAVPADYSARLSASPKESLPPFIPPQLAVQAKAPPAGPEWLHELKLDGYRMQARIGVSTKSKSKGGRPVVLFTRSGLDWTPRMKQVAASLAQLPVESAVLDGEVVVLDAAGLSSFAELQAAFQDHERKHMIYYAFDLLHLNGHNLCGLPLIERKMLLRDLLQSSEDRIRFSDHIEGKGEEMFSQACKHHAEGVVSKLKQTPYQSGRNNSWVKAKCSRQQEFVVGGFTLPSNGGHGLGALLLGYYDHGKLLYAGRTGTGFTQKTQQLLRKKLEAIKVPKMAYADVPREGRAGATWVKPELVAEVAFATWTNDNVVRQAAFKGLREDRPAGEVTREVATAAIEKDELRTASRKPTTANHSASQTKAASKRMPAATLPVKLTHADKILDTASGLTKQALAEYYFEIAPHLLPHIADRPLSIIRCPDGASGQCFFQRHLNRSLPKGVEGIDIQEKNGEGTETYITLSTPEALVGLAQMNVLELHPWGSRNEDIEHPDRLIFDLDPDEVLDWRTVADGALEMRKRLNHVGLKSFLKTTGGKGLHVVAPIEPEHDWHAVKQFAHTFVLQMEAENSKLYLTKMTKAARKGRIYLDYLRNERGATAVAPFSPRARSGMPVSLPLAWSELKSDERPRFRVADFAEWKMRLRRDPWKDMPKTRQSLRID